MAKWKETLEPYTRVIESLKTVDTNPTAGEDLIVAAVIISDSGPATPTLITTQREFMKTYASEEINQEWTDSLNDLYVSDPGSSLASTMWLNAYRLVGSTNLLVCRASKAKDLIYAKPIARNDNSSYVLKNSEILKRVPNFKFVLDQSTTGYTDGWAINITDTGVIGNKVTDDGPIYDYKVDTLPELVDQLNETTKFFSPKYSYYTDVKCTEDSLVEESDIAEKASEIKAVLFEEVYLGSNFINQELPLVDEVDNENAEAGEDGVNDYVVTGATGSIVEVKGMTFILAVDPEWQTLGVDNNKILDLNDSAFSGFDGVKYYATNLYNSRTPLQIRIRRFNHNAVAAKVTSDAYGQAPTSPYIVDTRVLDKYTSNGTKTPSDSILKYDFFEVAVSDPSVSEEWQLFNIGNIGGRGDVSAADLNDNLGMIHLTLPDDLHDLGLSYYGYDTDNYSWVKNNEVPIAGSDLDSNPDIVSDLPEIEYNKNGTLKNLVANSKKYIEVDARYSISIVNGEWIEATGDGAVVDSLSNNEPNGIDLPDLTGKRQGDVFYKRIPTKVTMYAYDGGSWHNGGTTYDLPFPSFIGTSNPIVWNVPSGEPSGIYSSGAVALVTEYNYKKYTVGNVSIVPDNNYNSVSSSEFGDIPSYSGPLPENPVLSNYSIGSRFSSKSSTSTTYDEYELKSNGEDEISMDISIKRTNSVGEVQTCLLDVSDSDIMQAWSTIEEDERYIVEGMTDLGNTYSIVQNYMANIAVNSNYFYAVSTINSTNYMTIANKKQKITKDSSKLYFLSPWDYDDGTVGYLFQASPSVMYWECVSRNKVNRQEFAPAFGQNTGLVTPVNLSKEFKKSERQLLLTKKINTIFHDVNIERTYINDSYTAQSEDNIRKEENIERTIIHISKNMPVLLNQFKGRINSSKTRKSVEDVIRYWFRYHMIPASGDLIEDFRVICDEPEILNSPEVQRANKLNVEIKVRYRNSIKYITVYNETFPIGVEFES